MKTCSILDLEIESILARRDVQNRLDIYFEKLLQENRSINLVSRETNHGDLRRLSAESLLPLDWLDLPTGNYLDIGSGGGFPAIPILLSGAISGNAFLCERTLKRAAALRRLVDSVSLEAKILENNYGEFALDRQFSLVTLRSVRLTPKLLRSIRGDLANHGILIYYATPRFDIPGADVIHYKRGAKEPVKSFSIIKKRVTP